jgi:signal transduction histidine kinase/DNA-binding NarL/FixJ family response regulator
MTGKKVIYNIFAAFILGNLILIFIQYNSAKNITGLIEGNETLVNELRVSAQLKELQTNISTIESRIRGTVATRDSSLIEGLETQITEVRKNLSQLQKISDNDSSVYYVDMLDYLVQKKLESGKNILDSFRTAGRGRAERMIGTASGKRISDSIILVSNKLQGTREKLLLQVTSSLDKSGDNARNLSTILIVTVLAAGAGLFWFIINIILKQNDLITQLNVSEKKVKEAAKMKENFLANMSHEIRTPMNAILGFTNLLQRKNLDQESKDYVKTIQNSGDNLLTIINDILDLSKIEAGMVRIEHAPFSIREVAESIHSMFRAKAEEKGLDFTIAVDPSVPAVLEGDATRLMQVLVNLVSNALKFTDQGHVTVSISPKEESRQQELLSIVVADTGIGIPRESLESVFKRFQQAENSTTRRYGGTGLGLSIVHDLVELQNGNITLSSEEGKGSVFTITLPYQKTSAVLLPADKQATTMPEISQLSKLRLLVVEDNEINISLITHLFRQWAVFFNIANNGKEAIEMIGRNNYDLVLMDIQMPEMDGYTATKIMREQMRITTPVIAMTAHALQGEKEKCLAAGMTDYIAKPIREKELLRLIAKHANIPIRNEAVQPQQQNSDQFQTIDLSYMREVSNGNAEYEKLVTTQFIELMPEAVQGIQKAWKEGRTGDMRHLAHDLKTTISVMGLNEKLNPLLDRLENETLTNGQFQSLYDRLQTIAGKALQEAKVLLDG